MADTPQRLAWLAGHEAGEADALETFDAPTARSFYGSHELPEDRNLWPAWIQGYGYGITSTVPSIPGHRLTMRPELTSD